MKSKRLRVPKMIKRRGVKGFYVRITLENGSRPYIKLGDTRKEATVNYLDYIAQLKSRKTNFHTYRMLIKQGINYYLERKRVTLSNPNTLVRYREVMENFSEFLQGKYISLRYMDELQQKHFEDFQAYRIDKGRKPVTVNFETQTISGMFNLLIDNNYFTQNPLKKLRSIKEHYKEERCLTEEELDKVLDAAKIKSKTVNWFAVFSTFYYTGMRRNELRFLTWEDIDFNRKVIIIQHKKISLSLKFKPKTDKIRNIPIHKELLPVLKSLPKKSKWVFCNSKCNYIPKNEIRDKLRQICGIVDIPMAKVHTFRHTWTAHSIMKGLPLDVVQKIGGWKSKDMIERYKHLAPDYISDIYN